MEKLSLNKTYRVLTLEDNSLDQQLLEETLKAAGIHCDFMNARSRDTFEKAVERIKFDVIISDFSLPGYDGMSALHLAQRIQKDTPFLFVSGTIGEERAIESLKEGATDYILKSNQDRLVSAVQRALRDSEDRAERKKLEEQLRQSQKMEAIGQLAGGVAHDFNNLLSVIRGNAELALMSDSPLTPAIEDCLNQITGASDRAANLTRQLLAFGRKQSMQPQVLNLNEVIKNLMKMLERVIGENIRLFCDFRESEPLIHADASMMEQILMNIIVNARDAMPKGGEIMIGTNSVSIDADYVRTNPEAIMGEYVCLSVTDTGSGISPKHLPHIFEPFFSTKEVGKGTGLGLATVYGIVKQHVGWIEVMSHVGTGTTFKIFFPTMKAHSVATAPPPAESAPQRGTETILLAEDDPAVRSSTRRLLENFGYKVLEADNAWTALDVWEQYKSKIDLLITDLVMPGGLTGRELAQQLRARTPGIKIIYMSGYSVNVVNKDTDFLLRNRNNFLQKPFRANVLLNSVRQCLDGAAATTAPAPVTTSAAPN